MIGEGEIGLYDLIKDNCEIVFDIGCREDTYYAENSNNKIFHLFEPNPIFYKNCQIKFETVKIENNQIFLNNFGLGNKTEQLEYYEDAQSFLKRHVHFHSKSTPIILNIKRFTEYLEENNISKIDLLKIDTEGKDPDILLDNVEFIKSNVKYVQFEYASTWLDRNDNISLGDIYKIFSDVFDFAFLFDHNHPISNENRFLLTFLRPTDLSIIDYYMQRQYGCNIVMIRRGLVNF